MKPHISKEVRAKLKRLCPYTDLNIPEWEWEDGSGAYQCEVELCDMDAKTSDTAGYVAIRPLEQDKYALIFMLGIPELSGPKKKFEDFSDLETFLSDPPSYRKDLIFDSIQEAKRYLDALLAADTPEIPL